MQLIMDGIGWGDMHLSKRIWWITMVPVSVLGLASIGLSVWCAWNLLGPYESRLSYRTTVGVFVATAMLVASVVIEWTVLRLQECAVKVRPIAGVIAIVLAVLPSFYYLRQTRLQYARLLDSAIWLVAAFTLIGQWVLAGALWRSCVRRRHH